MYGIPVIEVVSGLLLFGLIVVMLGALGFMSFWVIDKGGIDE